MSPRIAEPGRPPRPSRRCRLARGRVLAAALLASAGVSGLAAGLGHLLPAAPGAADVARAATGHDLPTAGDSFVPELGLPATAIVAFGGSPGESPGEAWAYGQVGDVPASAGAATISNQPVLLEHTGGSWRIVPLPSGSDGQPLPYPGYGADSGRATPAGGVVLLTGQNVVVRDPGGAPRLAPSPTAALLPGESLIGPNTPVTIPYNPIDETGGHTGLLIAPYHDGGTGPTAGAFGVLHFSPATGSWTREPIDVPSGDTAGFTPLDLACGPTTGAPQSSDPSNCWLLAGTTSGNSTRLLLFSRLASADPSGNSWEPEPVNDWLLGGGSPPAGVSTATAAPRPSGAQMLTVTATGVWADLAATIDGTHVDASELLSPGAATGTPAAPSRASAQVAGRWCYPSADGCPQSLGAPLPSGSDRSFAWPGGSSGDPGTRIITGLGDRSMLELAGPGSFSLVPGPGGSAGEAPGGAAFDSPGQGYIADDVAPNGIAPGAGDGQGGPQVVQLTSTAPADPLRSSPVPFGAPLLAVAPAPGATPADPSAAALAVGVQGQIARYRPGAGWEPEALYSSRGQVQTPTLRGVAWPQAGRAYAVGDNGAMWLWQGATGQWEPDPAKPFDFAGNLTAIAFAPGNPQLGYAVGKQGVLLRYDKTWSQVGLPPALQDVNFTSIAFAGGEALATYRAIGGTQNQPLETGGLAVNDGSGWQVDAGASALLAGLPAPGDTVLSRVAGLPDGGAVAAGSGIVIERNGPGDAWHFAADPLPEAGNTSALAAYRDPSGTVRALVSIDVGNSPNNGRNGVTAPYAGDVPFPSGPGQPPPIIPPDPLPVSGYLLQETAAGWQDIEHATRPATDAQSQNDEPLRPDPVLGLISDPSAANVLAVGGQTGAAATAGGATQAQTAAVMRLGAPEQGGATAATSVTTDLGQASFVLAGQAACAQACADQAVDGLGPDTSLTHALAEAGQIHGARAFLYAGGRLAPGVAGGLSGDQLARELGREAAVLGAGGSLPVYVADSADVSPGGNSGPFTAAMGPFLAGGASPYYAFRSTGTAGPVQVIVLDYSAGSLGATQTAWLTAQLAAARQAGVPAIVMGNDALGFTLPDAGAPPPQAADARQVSQLLVQGGASAYLFDYPGGDVATTVNSGGASIPAFGSGTLGYVPPNQGPFQTDSLGSSALLVVSVNTARRSPTTGVAPVSARAIPNVGQLALHAVDGTFLRRSQVALFQALARRPAGGTDYQSDSNGPQFLGATPYDPIPFSCSGANCPYQVPEQFAFTSSDPKIGDFVRHDPASADLHQVALGTNGLPIPDPTSGLFCAYNPGTTTVTIATGGLTYSLPVTVQSGSVQYPCGTVPSAAKPPPPLPPPPPSIPQTPNPIHPFGSTPSLPPPPHPVTPAPHVLPGPHVVAHYVARHPAVPAPPARPAPAPALFPIRPLVPSPAPSAARPIPPSGTAQVPVGSPVAESVSAAERQREEETAEEVAQNMTAYHPDDGTIVPPWSPALLIIAAAAGAGIRRRGRSPELARATARVSAQRHRRGR